MGQFSLPLISASNWRKGSLISPLTIVTRSISGQSDQRRLSVHCGWLAKLGFVTASRSITYSHTRRITTADAGPLIRCLEHQRANRGWQLRTRQFTTFRSPAVLLVNSGNTDWSKFFHKSMSQLARKGITAEKICAVFIETMQGWGAVPLPVDYVKTLRTWADANDVLLVFDEVQTGFARTGKMFAHEHYGVKADLLCIGKGLTSTLPLAAVLGPADILDLLAACRNHNDPRGSPRVMCRRSGKSRCPSKKNI